MPQIAENLQQLQKELPGHVTLIAVSKTHPVSSLQEAYNAGQRDFGENKVQELQNKHPQMPEDVRWHMIGHLQRNKVKYIAPFVHLIQSVDSLRLLREIDKRAAQAERQIACLLQVHIAEEDTKFGFSGEELEALFADEALKNLEHVQIQGLMGMATFTEDEAQVRREFASLASLFHALKAQKNLPSNVDLQTLSMGMSGDYALAIEEGSTMVRVGSKIFGARNYATNA